MEREGRLAGTTRSRRGFQKRANKKIKLTLAPSKRTDFDCRLCVTGFLRMPLRPSWGVWPSSDDAVTRGFNTLESWGVSSSSSSLLSPFRFLVTEASEPAAPELRTASVVVKGGVSRWGPFKGSSRKRVSPTTPAKRNSHSPTPSKVNVSPQKF